MAWIESHTVLARHWKLVSFAQDLRLSIPTALGHLHCLWHTALEQQEDGDLSAWSADRIAAAAMFTGDASRFVEQLIARRWLEADQRIHDWNEHAGRYLKGKYGGGKATPEQKAKLDRILAKYAPRVPPGGSEGIPRVPPGNLTIPTNPPTKGEGREFFNRGMHTAIAARAKSLVALYMSRVKTKHRSTKAAAEDAVAQTLIDYPALDDAVIQRGIEAFAKECEGNNTIYEKRPGPLSWFEKRSWESYDGTEQEPKATKALTAADIEALIA